MVERFRCLKDQRFSIRPSPTFREEMLGKKSVDSMSGFELT